MAAHAATFQLRLLQCLRLLPVDQLQPASLKTLIGCVLMCVCVFVCRPSYVLHLIAVCGLIPVSQAPSPLLTNLNVTKRHVTPCRLCSYPVRMASIAVCGSLSVSQAPLPLPSLLGLQTGEDLRSNEEVLNARIMLHSRLCAAPCLSWACLAVYLLFIKRV